MKKPKKKKKKKKKRKRSESPMPRDTYSISWKLRRVIEYEKVILCKQTSWLDKRCIERDQMNRWIQQKPEWVKMSDAVKLMRSHTKHKNHGVGDFPVAEEILYEQFLEWRRMKYQVPLSWFSRRMKKIMKQRHEAGLEPNYDPKTGKVKGKKRVYTFGKTWAHRFKKRKGIRRRRRTNKKNASLWQRRPKMQKNLRFLMYRLQDPKLMAEKYMSLGSILRRKTTKKCDDNLAPEEITADSDEEDVTSSSDE